MNNYCVPRVSSINLVVIYGHSYASVITNKFERV